MTGNKSRPTTSSFTARVSTPPAKLLRPARITVFHNGLLVQDNVEPTGPTRHHMRPPYTAGPENLPLSLQDHNHPVRYRNIWIRELK